MVLRKVTGFHQDFAGDWVAGLVCGHAQHVRHRPPFELREWVTTEAGRNRKLGSCFDCNYCDMPELPADARAYDCTPEFTEVTLPPGLRHLHQTRSGVWGRILIRQGLLRYQIVEPTSRSWILRPGVAGIIKPEQSHLVEPCGTTRFRIEFLSVPRVSPPRPLE
jgi:tellurite resistance-related uncharacterized protein